MTFSIRLAANARRDFYRAQEYYDAKAPDQTERFITEFFATARRLADFPYSGPELRAGARRANLHVFPYQLWYRVRDETLEIEVIALLHHRQDSAEFRARLV